MVNASVKVDGAQAAGLLITNGEFTAFGGGTNWCPSCSDDSVHVHVGNGTSGPVRFVNTAFWGPSKHVAVLEGAGTVGFSDCTFVSWDHENKGNAAILYNQTKGALIVRGSEFQHASTQFNMIQGRGAKAIITGNSFAGKTAIVGNGDAIFQSVRR